MKEVDARVPHELVEYARDRLREAILTNRLRAEDSFSQVRLAREFGISRTPLREAVRLLEYEGLTTVNFNRKVTVAAVSSDDLDALYGMRITLETMALHLRVPQMGDDFLSASHERLQQMREAEQAQDVKRWSRLHREFHLELVLGTGRRIDQQIKHCYDHAERYRLLYLNDPAAQWEKVSGDHAALQAACQARDRALATRVLTDHYMTTAAGVLARIDPNYRPAQIIAAKAMARGLTFID